MQTAWTVWDTHSGQIVGTEQVRLRSQDVAKRFPDLQVMSGQPAQQLITASAREAWRMLAPVVEKDHVRLAKPFFQPGSWRVRRGVRAAKQGQWQIAEMHWQRAADGWLPSPAAHHNLAIAKAAREDFSGAKHELQSATGILSRRLPPETLVWLDHNHQLYCGSLQLDEPNSGWAFHSPHANPTVAHAFRL